jgi:hypothetical protein
VYGFGFLGLSLPFTGPCGIAQGASHSLRLKSARLDTTSSVSTLAYAELSKQQLAVTRMLHNRVDRMPSLHHLALGLLALAATPVSAGVAHDICADFNTADMDPALSIYNTNGLCFTTCKDNYAYAITQYQSCWCSNYAPAKSVQVERGKCNTPCPAYPDEEQCGGQGLFGYIALANPPEGTRGPDSPSQTKESTSTSKSTTSKVSSFPQ